ncbi:unnamed protein product [Acanthoscelides obtectus]|uniref:MADF domain-containing protein n=1 Tax=Acanthoscelides obtectus TaxID=200917 RepID=A0A9P0KIU9_ACAOB|nr:unnamed protein product [Acanthoscelides obtectus]CAK1664823.1 hypothetical protein AOBTE_LOCUS24488 [Acanthoscelides obtectus]
MDKEMNIDNDLLIALVEARPVLWDISLNIFKGRNTTREACSQLCCELNEDFKEKFIENNIGNQHCTDEQKYPVKCCIRKTKLSLITAQLYFENPVTSSFKSHGSRIKSVCGICINKMVSLIFNEYMGELRDSKFLAIQKIIGANYTEKA